MTEETFTVAEMRGIVAAAKAEALAERAAGEQPAPAPTSDQAFLSQLKKGSGSGWQSAGPVFSTEAERDALVAKIQAEAAAGVAARKARGV